MKINKRNVALGLACLPLVFIALPLQAETPYEPNARIHKSVEGKKQIIEDLVAAVRENGLSCTSITAVRPLVRGGYALVCDHGEGEYELERKGDKWSVSNQGQRLL